METLNAKKRILQAGAEIVHLKGFHHTGIQEILEVAGVPKGSFYFHFKSKEDFGLQLIDQFAGQFTAVAEKCLAIPEKPHLAKMESFFDEFLSFFEDKGCQLGCPIGNLSQEMGDLNENFRKKLEGVLAGMKSAVLRFLEGARQAGEIPSGQEDLEDLADFIINSWEGALLRMKVTKDSAPLRVFHKMVFERILKK